MEPSRNERNHLRNTMHLSFALYVSGNVSRSIVLSVSFSTGGGIVFLQWDSSVSKQSENVPVIHALERILLAEDFGSQALRVQKAS